MKRLLIGALLTTGAFAKPNCNVYLFTKIEPHFPTTAISFKQGTDTVDFEKVADGFVKASKKNFDVTNRPLTSNLTWDGPEVPQQYQSFLISYKQQFSKANLDYELAEQSRTPMDVFARIVFQIGTENGMRQIVRSKALRESYGQVQSTWKKFSEQLTLENAEAYHSALKDLSQKLKPMSNGPTGLEGMLGGWRSDADFTKMQFDLEASDFVTGKKWDEGGKPFKTETLVKNLREQLEKVYEMKQKPGEDAFTWYLTEKNFAKFTASGSPLMDGYSGSELDFLIYKQLEAGMQQSTRQLVSEMDGPLRRLDMTIQRLDLLAQNQIQLDKFRDFGGDAIEDLVEFFSRK